MRLIATFVSHQAAAHFRDRCRAAGWHAVCCPAPREIDAPFRSCVRYEAPDPCAAPPVPGDAEAVYELLDGRHVRRLP